MTIKIYSTQGSRGMRPIWTAEEMGLDYEVEMMPFPPRFLQPEYMKINILGTIPYLIDGDSRMTESVGISQYFVEKYGPTDLKVNVEEDDYASYLNWLAHSDATITFPQTVYIRYTLQEPGVADKAAEGYKRWFLARLKLLEATLDDREYLCSNRFTIADICVSYALYLARSLGIDEAFKPNILRWTDMLFEREAFKKIEALKYDGPGPAGPSDS
jgi:glutathione S-transferase